MKIVTYNEDIRVPFLNVNIFVDYNSTVKTDSGMILNIEMFNKLTKLNIDDLRILSHIAFGTIKMPPVYWKHLKVLESIPGCSSPESIIVCPKYPIESLEYPGFYVIPGFNNYVISKDGILLKKSEGLEIKASRGPLGYYTYRMMSDMGKTQNQLRHRILCLTFHEYPFNVDDLDVNHKDGVPGNDNIDNLEWVTRSENIAHAYSAGLRTDNKPVEIRDVNSGRVYNFYSISAAARYLNISQGTVSSRAATNGYKSFDGYQFRYLQYFTEWPDLSDSCGKYIVTFKNGVVKKCSCLEASRLAGVTRTSLLRALRENRNVFSNGVTVTR